MKYLLAISCIATLFSCKPSAQKQEGKYFEGFVEFANSYQGKDTMYISAFKKLVGVKSITYLGANGFYSREFIDSNNIILSRQIYRPDSLKVYEFKDASDSVFCYDVTRNPNSSFVDIIKKSSFKILNHTVDMANTKRLISSKTTGSAYYVNTTYYNDINYPIHPLAYKQFAHHSAVEVFSRSPYITTGYKVSHGDRMTAISIATRIVPSRIPSWHFEIPKNKTIIYQTQ